MRVINFIKRFSKVLILLAVLAVLLVPASTFAAPTADFRLEVKNKCSWYRFDCYLYDMILGLGVVFGKIFAFFLQLFAEGTVFMIQYGVKMIDNPVVTKGFEITLGFTNLIFVISIIIIAFSTILRFEAYSIKKMLPKLIIAALLVNFSLLIAGLMLDVSHVFTNFFISGGGESNLTAERIGNAFNPQQLLNNGRELTLDNDANPSVLEQFATIALGLFIAIVMTALLAFVMAWTMIMVLVRNIWIAFLLILMPLIWGFWVMPFFQEYWSKWWKKFIQWAVYLPTVTFFIWLAVEIALLGVLDAGIPNQNLSGLNTDFLQANLFEVIIRLLIIMGLIIAALKVSGAGAVIGTAALLAGGAFLGKMALGGIGKTISKGIMAPVTPWAGLIGGVAGLRKGGGGFVKGFKSGFSNTFGVGNTLGAARRGIAGWGQAASGIKAADGSRLELDGESRGIGNKIRAGIGNLAAPNLYGRTLTALSNGLTNVPAFAGAARLLGKMAASQRAGIEEDAKAEMSGLSKEAKKKRIGQMIKEGGLKAITGLVAADAEHLYGAVPHHGDELKQLVDTVSSLHPGTSREDIELLKKLAMHSPSESATILGKNPRDIIKSATTDAIIEWDKDTYNSAKEHMSTSQRRAWASRNGEAQGLVLGEEVSKLTTALGKFDAAAQTRFGITPNMMQDLQAVASGSATQAVRDAAEGHLSLLSDNKEFKAALDGSARSALDFANQVRSVVIRTKSDKGGHGDHPDANYQLITALGKLVGKISSATAGFKIPTGGGQGGGGHGGSH